MLEIGIPARPPSPPMHLLLTLTVTHKLRTQDRAVTLALFWKGVAQLPSVRDRVYGYTEDPGS